MGGATLCQGDGEAGSIEKDFDCWFGHSNAAPEHHDGHTAAPVPVSVPAYALFGLAQRQTGLVFRSRFALLTAEECANVIRTVDTHHATRLGGTWGTVRHSSVKTTDVAVEDVPSLRGWLLTLLHTRLYPMLARLYPILGDGSAMSSRTADGSSFESRLRVHDAFIVRYDAEVDLSLSLPEHVDTSCLSVILSLNSEQRGDYAGGGTWFEGQGPNGLLVNAEIGRAVAFAGPLRHAGYPLSRGRRHVLVLFLYVQDFHYGPRLSLAKAVPEAKADCGAGDDRGILPSGGEKGGFVVYRQTVELVNMLEAPLVVEQ